MKKIIKALGAIVSFLPAAALAITPPTQPTGVPGDLAGAITKVSNAVLTIIGVVAVLFLVIGGFQYVTSGGNPDSIQKAKNTILYGIIGLVFAILAYSIIKFITDKIA